MLFNTDGFRVTGVALTLNTFFNIVANQHGPTSPEMAKAAQFIDNVINPSMFTANTIEWAPGGPFTKAVEMYNFVILGNKGRPGWWPDPAPFPL